MPAFKDPNRYKNTIHQYLNKKEKFKYIQGFEFYVVTTSGRVFSIRSGKFLLPDIAEKGYKRVTLFKDNRRSRFLVHRLVAITFIEKIPGKNIVNHIDGNPENNDVQNLEWVTAKENVIKSLIKYTTRNQGELSNLSILTEERVDAIRCLLKNDFSIHKISRIFKISRSCIEKIKNRVSWRFYNAI